MAACTPLSPHLTIDELRALLNFDQVNLRSDWDVPEKWEKINRLRKVVAPALTKGLSEILWPRVEESQPLIELGSGVGYSFDEELSKRVIKTQPNILEGFLLQKQSPDPVYHLDILKLYQRLSQSKKRIPLFFALNVFDTMSKDIRALNLTRLSQLQGEGDKIVVMLDVNPYTNTIIDELFNQYPYDGIWPYFNPDKKYNKLSVVIIPSEYAKNPPRNPRELFRLFDQCQKEIDISGCALSAANNAMLQKKHNFKIVVLEDYYTEQVKDQLEGLGYRARSFYHLACVINNLSNEKPFTYKPVTDYPFLRDWSIQDTDLAEFLDSKGLGLPEEFKNKTDEELKDLHSQILAAEFLVIEGTKEAR
jgi:hypothetical protein